MELLNHRLPWPGCWQYLLSRFRGANRDHVQHVLVEPAKLAPRYDPDLALLCAREKQKGNANRATLAVARKLLAYLLAVDREKRDFVPVREFSSTAA